MIEPQPGDEGRRVVYRPHGTTAADVLVEHGIIVRWNEHYVFVAYDRDARRGRSGAKATSRANLDWAQTPP